MWAARSATAWDLFPPKKVDEVRDSAMSRKVERLGTASNSGAMADRISDALATDYSSPSAFWIFSIWSAMTTDTPERTSPLDHFFRSFRLLHAWTMAIASDWS